MSDATRVLFFCCVAAFSCISSRNAWRRDPACDVTFESRAPSLFCTHAHVHETMAASIFWRKKENGRRFKAFMHACIACSGQSVLQRPIFIDPCNSVKIKCMLLSRRAPEVCSFLSDTLLYIWGFVCAFLLASFSSFHWSLVLFLPGFNRCLQG